MYQRATLPNGLKVVGETIPYVHSASIGFWVSCGSRHETQAEYGISHLIEHMVFKGTQSRSAKAIAEAIDAVGGQLNAFTTKEYTCFYAKVLDQHFGLGMELLADMITQSLLDEEELQKEKNVVLEEIKSYEDSPDELVHDLFAETLLAAHPLGHPILGTPASIAEIDRKAIVDYKERFYTPDNACLAVAGNVPFDDVVAQAGKLWAALSGKTPAEDKAAPRIGQHTAVRRKDTEQVHLCIGTHGLHRRHDDKYAVLVLDSILGGSVSSRLFQELREERGLVYSTGSHHASYRDSGLFAIYAGTSMTNFNDVVAIIRQQLEALCEKTVAPTELRRAKEQLKGNLWLSLENTSNRMSRLAKSEMFYGHFLAPEEVVERIEQVTTEKVQQVAQSLFSLDKLVMAAVGPFPENLPKPIAEWNR